MSLYNFYRSKEFTNWRCSNDFKGNEKESIRTYRRT